MPEVIFKFDKEKDLWNIWDTCNFESKWSDDFTRGISPELILLCKGKKFKDVKDKLKKCRKKMYSSKLIPIITKVFNECWKNVNNEFFERLEKIMKKPFCCNKVTAYLTSVRRCPYNYKKEDAYFFVQLFNGIPNAMKTSGHEIMHIQFHNAYWPQIEKQIGKEKTADLKEALTVLLNLEFKDLWLVKDEGYSSHQKLREFIEKEWKKEPDFDILLEKCVEYFNGL